MISSLRGTVTYVRSGVLVIEVGGVGLQVQVSPRISAGYSVGATASLHTVLVVREDALTLYGFETPVARELFELLQTVTGIGPKVAQSALTVYDAADLIRALATSDSAALEKIPGLGKKGAQRVVLELHEKVADLEHAGSVQTPANRGSLDAEWKAQLTEALVGLGFTMRDARDRVDALEKRYENPANEALETLLRTALSGGVAQ